MIDIIGMEEEVLKDIRCTVCRNLLSATPVRIDASGNNICSCCYFVGDKSVTVNTIYEKLAQKFLFPCKYITEGCFMKLNFNNTLTHEEKCPYKPITCRSKDCTWQGILTEFVNHHKTTHPYLIIENNRVQQISDNNGYFLLVANEFYFLVEWAYYEHTLHLTVKILDTLELTNDVSFVCSVNTQNSESPSKIYCTIPFDHVLRDLPVLPISLLLEATLSEEIVDKRKEDLEKIICCKCSTQMVPPIVKCSKDHILCLDCIGEDYDYCYECGKDEINWVSLLNLESVAINSQYKCKWKDCDANFGVRNIQEHEQLCEKRIRQCLYCEGWEGHLEELISHFAVCTARTDHPVIKETEVTFSATETTDYLEQMLVAHHELFTIKLKPRESCLEITVTNHGRPSLYGWYRYEVDLEHSTDLNCSFNKNYVIKHKDGFDNIADVPCRDINKFGGSEFYKITVKIILLQGNAKYKNLSNQFWWRKLLTA